MTIGVEFGSFVIKIDNKIVKLQIWDTAGQESFRSITRIFYRGANCVFLCYDITRKETFQNVQEWLMEIKQHAAPDVVVYLIGNRVDEEEKREVLKVSAEEYCKLNKIDKFYETSALNGFNVEEVFSLAAKELYYAKKEADEGPSAQPGGPKGSTALDPTTKKEEKDKGCC